MDSVPNQNFLARRHMPTSGDYLMTARTSRKSVTFTQPFSLSGIDEVQPAGTYTVETDEELLPGLSFPA
jgi:hypothetical protein